ncbi:hypothetical protein BD414DRAFT_421671 [Trametes punicea]|nr:hypothetical protein BD414DRAFT_421671 [Trametes punicea]
MASVFHLLALLLLSVSVWGARVRRAPVSPSILSPSGLSQWILGEVQTVKWESDQNLDGINGTVYMGYIQSDGNPFLWTNQPLAENFSLADLVVNVRCPLNLPTGAHYLISLSIDGDDSDVSALFSVVDKNDPEVTSMQSPPAILSTTGGIPSATITRSSLVSVIGGPTTSASSADSTNTPSISRPTSSATQPGSTAGPSPSGKPNSARKPASVGIAAMTATILCAYWSMAGYAL